MANTFTWQGTGGSGSGDWNLASDWVPTGGPPGVSDTAILETTGTVTVGNADTSDAGFITLDSATQTLDILGILNVGTGIGGQGIAGTNSGTLTLTAGVLKLDNTGTSPGKLRFATVLDNGGTVDFANGLLANVTWEGVLDLSAANSQVFAAIQGSNPSPSEGAAIGLKVETSAGGSPGTVMLTGTGSRLVFLDYQTFSNVTIDLGSNATSPSQAAQLDVSESNNGNNGNHTASITLDTTTTVVSSGANSDAQMGSNSSGDVWVNKGLISAAAAGGQFNVNAVVTNEGNISVTNGDALTVRANSAPLGSITNTATGTITIDASSLFTIDGTLSEQGGAFTNSAGPLEIGSSGRISGFGTLTGAFNSDGTMEASGGVLDVTGGVSGGSGGMLVVDPNATFVVGGGVTTPSVTFSQGGPDEEFGFGTTFNTTTIHEFATTDTIWMQSIDDTSDNVTASYDAGVLSIVQGGATLETFGLAGPADYASAMFFANADTNGGTDITTNAACYAEGTRILTADGEIPVEALREGMLAATTEGFAPVGWLGHRRVACDRHPRPEDVWPVRVRAGAFGDVRPQRDLILSPDHAVLTDGVLIPVRYLVNGATIVQEPAASVVYWHVELPRHGVLFAEGLTAESYLDTGNRRAFANAPGGVTATTPEFSRPDVARAVWAAQGCAELVVAGPRLAAAKQSLLERAEAMGYATTDDPGLRLRVDGATVLPRVSGNTYAFTVPRGASDVRLVSRSIVPAWMYADNDDHRRLGVAVTALHGDGADILPPRGAEGWHAPEADWRWTTGDAALSVAGARHVEVVIAPILRYRAERPVDAATVPAIPVRRASRA